MFDANLSFSQKITAPRLASKFPVFCRAAKSIFWSGVALLYCAVPSSRAIVIDNFDEVNSPSPWVFSNGPEYPGATGSLTRVPGYSGFGACLSFNLTGGGNYVSATLNLPAPITAQALSLWVKHPGGACVEIRVVDSTGQTLHYSPNRPFSAVNPSQWYNLIVQFGQTNLFWDGANDGIVHEPIVAVSVLAKPTLDLIGTLDFDEVRAVPVLSLAVNPAAAAIPSGVSSLAGSTGVELEHVDITSNHWPLAQSLGFKWIRTEMFWTDVETTAGVYDFSWYDQVKAELVSHGMQADFILCYGNPIYTGGSWTQPPLTPSAVQGFAKFAHAAAAHYRGQGVQFEVWNEPDNATFWPDPSASAYAALSAAAIPQIHSGDPTAKVATGGLAGVDLAYLQSIIPLGGAAGANAIGLHPYRIEEPELLSGDLAETRARLATTVPANPTTIWSTEAGYSSAWYGDGDGSAAANRTTQAIYGARQILTAAALGIPFQVVFALHDHGPDVWDPEENFGIVDNCYNAKPLTASVQTMFAQTAGMTFLGNLPSPEVSLHILKFQSASKVLLVLWTDAFGSAGQQVIFPSAPSAAVTYTGSPLSFVPGSGGATTIHIGSTPVYLSFPVTGTAE
jgi:hypothetical protein